MVNSLAAPLIGQQDVINALQWDLRDAEEHFSQVEEALVIKLHKHQETVSWQLMT